MKTRLSYLSVYIGLSVYTCALDVEAFAEAPPCPVVDSRLKEEATFVKAWKCLNDPTPHIEWAIQLAQAQTDVPWMLRARSLDALIHLGHANAPHVTYDALLRWALHQLKLGDSPRLQVAALDAIGQIIASDPALLATPDPILIKTPWKMVRHASVEAAMKNPAWHRHVVGVCDQETLPFALRSAREHPSAFLDGWAETCLTQQHPVEVGVECVKYAQSVCFRHNEVWKRKAEALVQRFPTALRQSFYANHFLTCHE